MHGTRKNHGGAPLVDRSLTAKAKSQRGRVTVSPRGRPIKLFGEGFNHRAGWLLSSRRQLGGVHGNASMCSDSLSPPGAKCPLPTANLDRRPSSHLPQHPVGASVDEGTQAARSQPSTMPIIQAFSGRSQPLLWKPPS